MRSWPYKAARTILTPKTSITFGPSTSVFRSALHERAASLVERAERLLGRDGGPQLVIVPRTLGLLRLLHLEQIHRVNVPAVAADLALAEQPVLGRHRLHLLHDRRPVRIGAKLLQRLQVVQ